jgi:hypothetical protein
MLILVAMLLMGLLAAVWGFLMCFLPNRWERFTESISVADRWTVASSKRLHPIVKLGNCIAGMAILAVGCWFTYVAASEMYLVFEKGDAIHPVTTATGGFTHTPLPALTVFSLFIVAVGGLMALFPVKAVRIFNRVWPSERTIRPLALPKIATLVRVFGIALVFMAIMSLIH